MNPINHQQYLLICLMEEAAEVQQACAKALRFGLHDGYPGTDRTNIGDIHKEITDFIGVIEEMKNIELLELDDEKYFDMVEEKEFRLREYFQIYKTLGVAE